jgi:hypothetical protein
MYRLARWLDVPLERAVGITMEVWRAAATRWSPASPKGDDVLLTQEDIEEAVRWPGPPETLLGALMDTGVGVLQETPEGFYAVLGTEGLMVHERRMHRKRDHMRDVRAKKGGR